MNEDDISELGSFSNQSCSETYEGVHGHIAQDSPGTSNSSDQAGALANSNALAQLLTEQLKLMHKQSEELTNLKVAQISLESELDRKNDIVTNQAVKIRSLGLTIDDKDTAIEELQQSSGFVDQTTIKQLSEMRKAISNLERELQTKNNLCVEKDQEIEKSKMSQLIYQEEL